MQQQRSDEVGKSVGMRERDEGEVRPIAAQSHRLHNVSCVRSQLFRDSEPARVAYIGGVFRSTRFRERFRRLVELADGVTCGPPEMGPAAGALLEAYRQAGLNVTLSDVPEIEKR